MMKHGNIGECPDPKMLTNPWSEVDLGTVIEVKQVLMVKR